MISLSMAVLLLGKPASSFRVLELPFQLFLLGYMLQCSDAVESILNQLIVRERDENNCHLGAKQRERSTFLQEALINLFDNLTAGPVK